MDKENLIKIGIEKFLSGEGTFTEIAKELKIAKELIIDNLRKQGYVVKKGSKLNTIVGLYNAEKKYIQNINNKPSITKIAKEFGIKPKTLSDRIKELGYEVINYQNMLKFDETIFDSIDSEEKAYWLGFIYADGCIFSDGSRFELSLNVGDFDHLLKFSNFIKHIEPEKLVKIGEVKCGDKLCKRCRVSLSNKHLWNTLNNYGCVPNKSLILQFPQISIFKSSDLIKHFIRGYWDGDGCLTYNNKTHTSAEMSVLGTEDFLTDMKKHLPLKYDYLLQNKSSKTKILTITGKNAFELSYFLYNNSNLYLNRKFNKFLDYCRLYKELYKELLGNIGEDCDVNPEINSEIKESESSYSVEGETYEN